MGNSIKEIEEEIDKLVTSKFMLAGFKKEQNKLKYTMDNSAFFLNQFEILIKQSNNYYTMHLILTIYDSKIGDIRREVKNIITSGGSSKIKLSKAMLKEVEKNNSLVAALTDWKILDKQNETHIWFESFTKLSDINNFDTQFDNAIALSLIWFQKCSDIEYLIQFNIDRGLEPSIETALILTYINFPEKTDSVFNKIFEERESKKLSTYAITQFYKALEVYSK